MSRLCPHDSRFLSDKSHLSVSLIVHLRQIPQYQWDFCGTCMSAWLGSISMGYRRHQVRGTSVYDMRGVYARFVSGSCHFYGALFHWCRTCMWDVYASIASMCFIFAWLCLIRTRSKRRRWLNKNACVLHCDIGPASRVGLEVLLLPVSFVLAFCLFRVFLLSWLGHLCHILFWIAFTPSWLPRAKTDSCTSHNEGKHIFMRTKHDNLRQLRN